MRKLFRRLLFCLGAGCVAATPNAGARTVWIDTDLSIGSPLREVDDAYALLFALRSPELQIAGVSTTYGNAPLSATTKRTRDSLGAFGAHITVSPGTAAPDGFGRPTTASEALAAALRREKLTYIALGPLTNLATFLKLYPAQARQIEQVVMVAGKTPEATLGFGPHEKFRIHDANLVKDRAAVRAILHSSIPIVLAPIETSSRLLLEREDLRSLEISGPAGRYLAQRSRVWLWFWSHLARARGGPIFDALAVVAAAKPQLLTIEKRFVAFDAKGELIVHRRAGATLRMVLFCSAFSSETKNFVLHRLGAARSSYRADKCARASARGGTE